MPAIADLYFENLPPGRTAQPAYVVWRDARWPEETRRNSLARISWEDFLEEMPSEPQSLLGVLFASVMSRVVEHPLLVLEGPSGFCGYISFTPLRSCPYLADKQAELSLYVRTDAPRGAGTQLTRAAVSYARSTPLEWLFLFVATSNAASIRLLEKLGHVPMGTLPRPRGNSARPATHVYSIDVSV